MSHGIEQDGDKATFVAVGHHGWHKLGYLSSVELTVREAMRLAYLADLEYQMRPVLAAVGTPIEFQIAEGKWAVVRRNPFNRDKWDILHVGHTDDYVLHTPEEVFAFGEQIIEQGHPLSALGSINGGRRAFAAFKLDGITVGGFDQIDMFLNVLTDFTGGMSTLSRVSGIRTVCANTFNGVLGQVTMPTYRVRHTGAGLSHHVDEARRALEIGWRGLEEFQREAEIFLSREITNAEFDKIIEALIPIGDDLGDRAKANRQDDRLKVRTIYEAAPTTEDIRGTAWGALNAATEWLDWSSGQFANQNARMVAQITPGSRIDVARGRAGDVVAKVLGVSV